MSAYVPLHCYSSFSFHAGVPSVKDLVGGCKSRGMAADRMCHQLRHQGLVARRLTFRLRHTDNQCVQRSTQLPQATADFDAIAAAAGSLFTAVYGRRAAIKSMSLSTIRPSHSTAQIDLFETVHERKLESLGTAITDIRLRLGFDAVLSGASSHPQLRAALRFMDAEPGSKS